MHQAKTHPQTTLSFGIRTLSPRNYWWSVRSHGEAGESLLSAALQAWCWSPHTWPGVVHTKAARDWYLAQAIGGRWEPKKVKGDVRSP